MGKRLSAAQVERARPRDRRELARWVEVVLGIQLPSESRSGIGATPLDYLEHSFFEHEPADAVVWANRGGGKTLLGAAATVLDLVYKPGIRVRVLGGSLAQSSKMHEHLVALFDRPALRGLMAKPPTQRRLLLANGSEVELLAQSHRSVRGTRVHKLRCDEVDEFRPDVWQAAQLVTRTETLGGVRVRGAVHAFSTMHRPYGLMSRLLHTEDDDKHRRVFRWNYIDVIGRCEPERVCEACELWGDCRGQAKEANGFLPVEEVVRQWWRSSKEAWAAEMACKRPRRSDLVYPGFDPAQHVQPAVDPDGEWVGGMDFGIRSPTVMLWAQRSWDLRGQSVLHVVHEYADEGQTIGKHLDAVEAQDWPALHWLAVDPAGVSRNGQTGVSDVQVLKQRGYQVRVRRASIAAGVERVRQRLDHGTLRVDPRCVKLIEALETYHFDAEHPGKDEPVKDGPDHACDALRYMVMAEDCGGGKTRSGNYLTG